MGERSPLRAKRRPKFEEGVGSLRVVDLFAGCGGLTLGIAQAAHKRDVSLDVRLAVDFEAAPTKVFKANFPNANVQRGTVESYFDGDLGSALTAQEDETLSMVGEVGLLIGGPPCQGHSNLNNHTRRDDPKNRLYLRMARATEVLRPRVVVIENVLAVVNDKQQVVSRAIVHLKKLGYEVATKRVDLLKLGVAQTRKRHILLAVREDALPFGFSAADLLQIEDRNAVPHDLNWAIGDLLDVQSKSFFDEASVPSADNQRRMKYLFDNDEHNLPNEERPECHRGEHNYTSMYGRLWWDRPSQTITSGFATMGRGRFVHPSVPRCLTAHEAARIQGFPDYFKFVDERVKPRYELNRTEVQVIIGNAVPPPLTEALTAKLFDADVLQVKDDSPQLHEEDFADAAVDLAC
ncbi:DNA cytosine methyltransferase [Streptomyces endophyticus]|uniref:DNA (cytosine-5-)-methyltransferase n=1 Tax=Streptomyces endophyticus TaxID=714166 RepID=A0ABU6FIN7_9ACTN|nr:DNA cytosine methyltransferase [Streptomyces endophyticus]MEB8343916.1 DNA cytosine methyltransferase [Streptomyces endophyticus]